MISPLYPCANLSAQNPLNNNFLTYQRLSSKMLNSQWQILINFVEERINGLRLIDRLSAFHTTLLRSGLCLFGLEMEVKWLEGSVESVPNLAHQYCHSDDEVWLNTTITEIEVAEEVVNQCGREKLLAKNEVAIILCGLRLLRVELEELKYTQCYIL